jgi:hypothetical protein
MYARVPDLYGIVAHNAFAAIAAAQNSGLFRYAGYWFGVVAVPVAGFVNRPSVKGASRGCPVLIGVGAG